MKRSGDLVFVIVLLLSIFLVLVIAFWCSLIIPVQPPVTATRRATATVTVAPTKEPTFTPTKTPFPTFTPTQTPLPTFTPTQTPLPTFTPTRTPLPTVKPTREKIRRCIVSDVDGELYSWLRRKYIWDCDTVIVVKVR